VTDLSNLGCLDVPGWTGRVGGPAGRHSRVTKSSWFNPVPWTILASVFTWVVLMCRQVPCLPSTDHPYQRMCYSDIPVLFQWKDMIWSGSALYQNNPFGFWSSSAVLQDNPFDASKLQLEYPVLTSGFIWLGRWLAGLFGATISMDASGSRRLAAANLFWGINSLLLFGCLGILVWSHLQMGRDSAAPHTGGVPIRAWDALYIAASPVIMLAGLINWDLLAVALTSVSILLWARRHPVWSGCLIGLAAAAKFYPLAMLAVLLILCLRSSRWKDFGLYIAGGAVAWTVVNLPTLLTAPQAWSYFWTYNAGRGPDLGSLWYVLTLMGVQIGNVSILEVVFITISAGVITTMVIAAPRRPRVGQVAMLVMVAFLAFNKVYSPQYVLWLLPLVVLARPVLFDLLVFTVSESLYYLAVWGFLGGALGIGTGPDRLYWLAVLFRVGVQLWLAGRVVRDIWQPWNDPVRGPFVDDPIGGVLNHAPDAGWLLRRTAETEPDEMNTE